MAVAVVLNEVSERGDPVIYKGLSAVGGSGCS